MMRARRTTDDTLHSASPRSPCIRDVFYPVDIRRATGDKARLNPPNQLCFTVLATLPLYIASIVLHIYLLVPRACTPPLTDPYARRVIAAVWVRTLSPGIPVRGYVKRKHQGDRYRHDARRTARRGAPWRGVPLLYGVADSVPRGRSLRVRNFIPVAPRVPRVDYRRRARDRIVREALPPRKIAARAN